MSDTTQIRRVLHREKPDGRTLEFALEKIDQLLLASIAAIPFDNPTAHSDWLLRCVASGELSSVVLRLDDLPVGCVTFAVVGDIRRELLVTTAHVVSTSLRFLPALNLFLVKLAKERGCEFIRFHTVRKGLIHEALALGFHVSEIVLRKEVK